MSYCARIPATLHCISKKVGDLWSVRVTLDYRALAVEAHDSYVWFWIGTHEDYDKILG